MAILKIKKKIKLLNDISAEMRKISDKTGEKIFSGVENIREKSEELNEKNAQLKKRMEELHIRYQQIAENRSFTAKRIENAFPKLKIIHVKSLKEQLEEVKTKIKNKKS